MRTQIRKVTRDLQTNKASSSIVVIAIAIGLAGFGTLLSAYSILTRELNTGYLKTNPASATLWTGPIDETVRGRVSKFQGIEDFEERRTITGRVSVGPNEWRNVYFYVIPDFKKIRISKIFPQNGSWPPGPGEILIERDALGVARAKIGDTVKFRMASGHEQTLRIAGTVHDAGQAQARMEQLVYGYIDVKTLQLLGEEAQLNQIKIVIAGDSSNESHVRTVVADLKQHLERNGHVVSRVEVPEPGKHPHADLMGALLLFKSSFGLFALLLSGVLVANLISASLAGQVRQIGVMKAIGGTRKQIAVIYLGSILLLSLFAQIIAFPISIFASRTLADFMARFLNFDLESYAIDLWVYALQFAVGIIIPLTAAFIPVMKGSRITVRDALNDYGIQPASFGSSAIDALLLKVSTARPLILSLRNTFRRKGRLALTLGTLALGGTIFIAAWNVRASLIRTADLMFEGMPFDLSVSLADYYNVEQINQIALNTEGVLHAECWTAIEAIPISNSGQAGNSFTIAATPHQSKLLRLNIVEGRNLKLNDTNTIVVNNRLAAQRPDLRAGGKVKLRIGNRTEVWLVSGEARQAFSGASAYANINYLSQLTEQHGKSKNLRIVTKSKDQASINKIRQKLEQNFAAAGIRTTSNISMAERRRVLDEHNSVIYTFLIVLAFLIVAVGGLGLMSLMSISVLERRREIGVMRAIGATRRKLMMIILTEGTLIGLLSWVIAIVIAALVSNLLGNFVSTLMFKTNLDSAIDITGIVAWLILVLVFGGAASFLPARNAARQTVRQLVEYE